MGGQLAGPGRSITLARPQQKPQQKPQQTVRPTINDFRLVRALNAGTFAHVWLAEKRTTGDVYALKAIRVDVTRLTEQGRLSEQEASLGVEQSILFKHTSDFLLRCFFSFRSSEHVFFALEYMPAGDLVPSS